MSKPHESKRARARRVKRNAKARARRHRAENMGLVWDVASRFTMTTDSAVTLDGATSSRSVARFPDEGLSGGVQ